jgi:hypothetical protein
MPSDEVVGTAWTATWSAQELLWTEEEAAAKLPTGWEPALGMEVWKHVEELPTGYSMYCMPTSLLWGTSCNAELCRRRIALAAGMHALLPQAAREAIGSEADAWPSPPDAWLARDPAVHWAFI